MFFIKFIKRFFSEEFLSYEKSQLEFRIKNLKILQHSLNIFLIIFMAVVFPILKMNLYYYIFLPTFFIFNNLVICFLTRKKYQHLCPRYLFFLQFCFQTIGLELTATIAASFTSKRALLMGIQLGLSQTIGFLNLSSSLLKFTSSIILFLQILVKLIVFEAENLYTSLTVVISVLLFVNFVYYRFEALNFNLWNSYVRSNKGLLHFQKLIEIFPSHIAVIDYNSFQNNKALYLNRDAERLESKIFKGRNGSIKKFFDLFRVDVRVNERHFEKGEDPLFESPNFKITLTDFANDMLLKPKLVGTFDRVITEYDNFKWELEYGWIEWNGEPALILILNDISQNEKITALEELDRNKDRILATVSHELRTPLNSVIGMIDVSLEETPEDCLTVRNYLKVAKESASSLALMINNILDLELIRKGKLHLNMKRTMLSDALENVLPIARVLARKSNLEFKYENYCSGNTSIFVDSFRFKQILINLFDNAAKFTSEGYIKFSIKYKNRKNSKEINSYKREKNKQAFLSNNSNLILDSEVPLKENYEEGNNNLDESSIKAEEAYIKLTVEDSGLGIRDDKKNSLFKLFGKEATNISVRGLGLGLAISQNLAIQMGSPGICLKSEVGKGSKFYFTLRADSKEDEIRRIPEEEKKSISIKEFPLNDSNKRIINAGNIFRTLIVDDDDTNHLVISLYLKTFGKLISADKAYNGKEALKMVFEKASNNTYYDLVLMDCDMPVMNGIEATILLKEAVKHGRIPDIKIIALTANASIFNRECCIQQGMADVWNKPISKNEFLRKLSELLPRELRNKFSFFKVEV